MRLIALIALASLSLPPARGQGAEDAPAARAAVAEAFSAFPGSGASLLDLMNALVGLGPEAIAPLFEALAAGSYPEGASAAVLSALVYEPADALRAYLEQRAGSAPSEEERCAALSILAYCAGADDLKLCIAFASPAAGAAGVPRARRLAFEETLAQSLRRAPEGAAVLAGLLPRIDPSLAAPVVRLLAADRSPETLALLANLLGRTEGSDTLLLAEIAGQGRALAGVADESVLARVRPYLAGTDRYGLILAVQAVAALEDTASVGKLIALLSHDDPSVGAAAETALTALVQKHCRGAEAWERWHEAELAWWSEEGPRVLGELEATEPAVAIAALRALAEHRLYRQECAQAIAGVLWRPEPDLVLAACSALGDLKSARALPELLQLLEHGDEPLARAAASALRAVTGLALPADAALWREALGPERLSQPR